MRASGQRLVTLAPRNLTFCHKLFILRPFLDVPSLLFQNLQWRDI